MSHRNLVTQVGSTIPHWHKDQVYGELTPTQKAQFQAQTLAAYPGIAAVQYVHLNHSVETLGPTNKYNCWGFTFNPRQCWVGLAGGDIQAILNDNGTQVSIPNLRVGDVVCYRDGVTITHTGRIWSLDASGKPALVQSKWGSLGEYLHPLLTVPAIYGSNVSYWRVVPIGGKGDAWSKDFAGDDRNVSPPGVALYLSPDLWCNNSGGTGHVQPVRNVANKLWVRVHNEDTLAIKNAKVHLYWSDPTGGMPHYHWHPIGIATVSVPAGPGTEAIAGPVSWTPGSAEPAHCCLFAVLDTGDDPCAAQTLDPIVWPFDVRRDNNVVWKNMFIAALPAPSLKPPVLFALDFFAANPTQLAAPVEVNVRLNAIEPGELAVLGFDRTAVEQAEPTTPAISYERSPLLTQRDRRLRGDGVLVLVAPEGEFWLRSQQQALVQPGISPGTERSPSRQEVRSRRGINLSTRPLPPGQRARMHLWVAPQNGAQADQLFRIDVEQRIGNAVTGGCTYVLVIKPESFTH